MANKVTSREYKVMLRTTEFGGDERRVQKRVAKFWRDLDEALAGVADCRGALDKIKKHHRRKIRFYDTKNCQLRHNDYVFRERQGLVNGEREVTLKFRYPDRYVSQARDMTARDGAEAKTKFEEDVKPPGHQSLYSFSTSQAIDKGEDCERLGDVRRLYPGIASSVEDFEPDHKIKVVGNVTAFEIVLTGAKLRLGRAVEASCAVIVWYDREGGTKPTVVEFSYNYGDDKEQYGPDAAAAAHDVLQILQRKKGPMKRWVDRDSLTKTAFVYSKADC